MAEQLLREAVEHADLDVRVDSAGISDEEEGNPIDYRAERVLREAGYGIPTHRARQLLPSELSQWDLIIAMTRGHERAIERMAARTGTDPDIHLMREFDPQADSDLDLPDPWYGGHQDFVDTLEVLERSIPGVVDYIREHRQ